MKKVLINLTLILGLVTFIGACKSSDDSSAATAITPGDIAGAGTPASGTITGNDNLTGTFQLSWYGHESSGGCVWTMTVQFQLVLI